MIRGAGPKTATAIVAAVGDGAEFALRCTNDVRSICGAYFGAWRNQFDMVLDQKRAKDLSCCDHLC